MHSHFIAVVDGLATVTVATTAVGTVVNAVSQIVSSRTLATPFSVRYNFIYGRTHFDPEADQVSEQTDYTPSSY